ncbi:LolA family protein [Desulfovibrio ferrophilus]|uniref:Outer membrane lipoprotein carrier protein LolA n=1 Tax=Desulfovibrio ferrophilus TaxID=241368 RepID=A0A2Z6AX18_9BACT|nr:outer membrane lipoprotein carrier protein LolA [Desulfovibrio ferrophilus]BBD07696.1 outer membrane lipoprotein carrier protein LolA [Desulfovibrio ferrophilus]
MLFIRIPALILTILICVPAAWASDVATLTASMQARYESLDSFSASFNQVLFNASSSETQQRAGNIAYRQPGLVRWETTTPEPELLVVGKDEVWSHFPHEDAAYKYTVEQVLSSKTVLRFISGKANLRDDFWVTSLGREDGLDKLELIPKEPEPEMVQAYLWLTPEYALLQKVQILDFFGNENTVILKGIVMNPELQDSAFSFTPPPGTDVYDNTHK